MKHNSNVMINSVFLVILYAVYHFFLSFFNKGIEIEIVMNVIFLTYILVLYIFGYMNFEDEMFRLRYIFYSFLINLAFATVLYVFMRINNMFAIFFILFVLENVMKWIIHTLFKKNNRVIIYGKNEKNKKIVQALMDNPNYKFLGYVSEFPETNDSFLGTYEELQKIVEKRNVNRIIITDTKIEETMIDKLLNYMVSGLVIHDASEFYESVEGRIDSTLINKKWMLETSGFGILHNRIQQNIKRILDISISSILLIVMFIPMILCGLIIMIDSKGPIFFKQKRVGLGNKVFKIIKFRTMKLHDKNDYSLYASDEDGRITKFGKFMRKTRMDELPQLICIFRGEMSFIGPRPEWIELVKEYSVKIPNYNLRHLIKPGITGWAQVNYPYGENLDDTIKKLEYDLYYMKHQTFLLDILIVMKTVRTVLFGQGK